MAALAGDAVEIVVFLGTGSPLFTFRALAKDEEAAEFGPSPPWAPSAASTVAPDESRPGSSAASSSGLHGVEEPENPNADAIEAFDNSLGLITFTDLYENYDSETYLENEDWRCIKCFDKHWQSIHRVASTVQIFMCEIHTVECSKYFVLTRRVPEGSA